MKKRAACARTRNSLGKLASCKCAQMKLSFGMIFSIFLILIFLAVTGYFIAKFINLQKTVQIETFKNDLQANVNTMWQSQQGSRKVTYTLPTKINAVCFIDDEYENFIFKSKEMIGGGTIDNIDIENITSGEEEYCIENIDGKVSMTLVKDYGESLVKIIK